jgi:hypothetical protein
VLTEGSSVGSEIGSGFVIPAVVAVAWLAPPKRSGIGAAPTKARLKHEYLPPKPVHILSPVTPELKRCARRDETVNFRAGRRADCSLTIISHHLLATSSSSTNKRIRRLDEGRHLIRPNS